MYLIMLYVIVTRSKSYEFKYEMRNTRILVFRLRVIYFGRDKIHWFGPAVHRVERDTWTKKAEYIVGIFGFFFFFYVNPSIRINRNTFLLDTRTPTSL